MSFILDALRKSELERQRQNGPSIAELPIARSDRRLPWALVAIGLLLAVNAGVLLYFLLREDAATAPTIAAAAPGSVAPAMAAAVPAPAPSQIVEMPAVEVPTVEMRQSEEDAPADATLPPPAPDPTLLPDAAVTYSAGPVEELPPPMADLPAQATAGLPELSVDLHIYTSDPAKRAVFINGKRYQRGSVLVEGPRVEEINPEGVVLSYHGRRFLLPRQ
jgi:general secretion pathway protein B